MYPRCLLAALPLLLLGCAAQTPETVTTDEPATSPVDATAPIASEETVADSGSEEPGIVMPEGGTQIVCVRERRTGSNRVTKRCRSRAEIEADRVSSKETFEGMRQAQEHIEQ